MHSIAWALNDAFFGDHFWVGFLIEAVIFFIVAAIAGLLAKQAVEAGAPPTPDMAIEEGKRIRQTLESGTTPAAKEPPPPAPEPPPDPGQGARGHVSGEPEIYSGAGRAGRPARRRRPGTQLGRDPRRHRAPARRSSRTRSRRCAAGSPSSPTGAARSASTAAS